MEQRRIQRGPEQRPNAWPVIVLVVAALVTSFGAFVRSREPAPIVPEALQGRWTTNEARYADRYIELGPATVAIGTGGLLGTISAVGRVTERRSGRRGYMRYEVEIWDPEGVGASTLEIDYRNGVVPTLALPNVAGYWQRERVRWP